MKTYGLTYDDVLHCRKKIEKQIDYLKKETFTTANGEEKCLLDVSYGANVSERYYSRILNKIDTFTSVSMAEELTPIFLTVTLDGFFRDCMRGDYKRFEKVRDKYIKHIPNSERNGMYLDAMDNKKTLTPKDLYKILSHQMFRFNRSSTLQRIRRDGNDYTMIRVTEPHQDGVPHFHILMYTPKEYLSDIYKEFQKFFPAPQNHKPLTMRQNKRLSGEISQGIFETQGFQTQVKNAGAYILKYILKSFRDVTENKEIDYLHSWYVKYRIPRIITTRSLMSQSIQHKVMPFEKDWLYLTEIKKYGFFENDTLNNKFRLIDNNNRSILFDNGLLVLSKNNKIIKWIGARAIHIEIIRLRNLKFIANKPIDFKFLYRYEIYITPIPYSYCIKLTYKDGTFCSLSPDGYHYFDFKDCNEPEFDNYPPLRDLKDFQLYNLYINFDFEWDEPIIYCRWHNELVKRGLINDEFWNDYDWVDVPF